MHPRRLTEIDALRGVAVAMVLMAHIPGLLMHYPPGWMIPLVPAFTVGVDIFFAISGFVIGRSLLPDMTRGAVAGRRWLTIRRFWLRRAWRLLPAAFLWLVMTCVLSVALPKTMFDAPLSTLHAAIAALFNLSNLVLAYRWQHDLYPGPLFHFWSLALEEQFYLVVPFVILLPRRWLIVALLLAAPTICCMHGPYGTVFRFEGLLFGVALAALDTDLRRFLGIVWAPPPLRQLLPVLSCAVLFAVMLLSTTALDGAPGRFWQVWFARLGVAAGSTLLVWVGSLDGGLLLGRGMIYRLLLGVGRRSYSIYLVHICAFFLTQEIMVALSDRVVAGGEIDIWTVAIGFALVAFFSEMTYRLVEKRVWRKPANPAGPSANEVFSTQPAD